jgi:hypothetical protein
LPKNRTKEECCCPSSTEYAFDHFGVDNSASVATPTFDQIRAQIRNGSPVLFNWQYPANNPVGSHDLLIIGTRSYVGHRSRSEQFLVVNNPAPVGYGSRCVISYDCFKSTIDDCGGTMRFGFKLKFELPAHTSCCDDKALISPAVNISRSEPKLDRLRPAVALSLGIDERAKWTWGTDLQFRVLDFDELYLSRKKRPARATSQRKSALPVHHLLIPLFTDECLLGAVELKRGATDPTWNLCCSGLDAVYRGLSALRTRHMYENALDLADYFAVRMATLDLWFLGVNRKPLQLIPTSELRALGLELGQPVEIARSQRSVSAWMKRSKPGKLISEPSAVD